MSFLEVRDLKKHFPIRTGILKRTTGHVYAVDGISFSIEEGETLGIVGESGCGKSTAARVILRLLEATAGSVVYDGIDVMKASRVEMQRLRRDMQIIFQDPYASLNPRMRVRNIIGEPLRIHQIGTPAERRQRVIELLETVGLNAEHAERYPHEFSGGQRQRIGVARALALNPRLIICDEPVSALDVSIRAQVINLLEDLQDQFKLTYVFIAHDLSVVKHTSDRVVVMYLGKTVEIASSDVLYERSPAATSSTTGRSTPTRRRCSRPCRSPIPRPSATGDGSCSKATCRVRPSRRRGASSTRAVSAPRRSARRRCRRSSAPAMRVPITWSPATSRRATRASRSATLPARTPARRRHASPDAVSHLPATAVSA